jgi:acyl-coenzyme A thioesterase PaaI-like protein
MSVNMDWHFAELPGLLHGGVIATVLDEAVELHAQRVLKVLALTSELNITYHTPVPTDVTFEVRARGTRDGDRVRSTAEIRAADGTVLAEAVAVLVAR